jgi:TonB-dependent receptor
MHATPINTPRPPGCVRLLAGLAAWLVLTLGLAAQSADTGTINGRVTDAISKSVLPGAEITVSGSDTRTSTGKDGEFSINLPADTYDVTVNYLGQPSKTVSATVAAGTATALPVVLGDDVVQLEAFKVEGTREGQARALNQQRASQNLTSIISSDLSGQFPDKTIADAVKRLPGVTVETDTDTGGSEGRYITIRGMNADFNTVTINGMRASVSDFEGSSRRVPLDVVSAKSADQIEVTKALRPDQDGDGIGGAVNIVTRSPFDRDGIYAFAEGSVSYSNLLDTYSGDYPYDNPGYEAAAGYSDTFGKEKQFGVSISANTREKTFVKQRVSTNGWAQSINPFYYPIGIVFQDFYDDVTANGFNTTFEWRPVDTTKLRFDLSYSGRDTERGRQRLQYGFRPGSSDPSNIDDGETYTTYTSNGRKQYRATQFFEEQSILNLVARGETRSGDWKFDYFAGANQGSFDGDPDKDISVRFRSDSTSNTFVSDGYTPVVTSSGTDVNDPTLFNMDRIDRGTSFVSDDEWAGGLDARRDSELFGGTGFWQVGGKARLFDRDYERRERLYRRGRLIGTWTLDGYTGAALPGGSTVGSSVADYNADSYVDGNYTDSRLFLDAGKLREYSDTLIAAGRLRPALDNDLRSQIASYDAKENVFASYAQGQFTWDKFTALSGARVEFSDVNFKGRSGRTFSGNSDPAIDFEPTPGTSYFDLGYRGGDIDPQSLKDYDSTNRQVSVLPGLHLRYDQTKNLVYRFAVTRSIARPKLSDLNPSVLEDGFGDNDPEIPTLDRGNIKLKPANSTNFDLGFEYYFNAASTVSFTAFYKDMKNNIYRGYDLNDSAYAGYVVRTSLNAKSAYVRGFEAAYDQQFTFLPEPFNGLGVFANYTFADSEVDTGLPQFAGEDLPLFNQVKNTINCGLFYDRGPFRSRVSLLYRSESLIGVDINNDTLDYDSKLSRYQAPSTTLDITASYRFLKNWQVFTEFQNVLNTPGRAYDGDTSRLDYNEYTDWSASVGLRWSL